MALCTDCGAQAYYTVSGDTNTFTFPFQYVEPGDVNVALLDPTTGDYVDLDRSQWTFENLTTIKLTAPPRVDIVIYRCTDVSQPAATFFPGNPIKAEDLNSNQEQVLNAIEELRCAIAQCCNGNGGGGSGPGGPCNDNGDCQPGLICVGGICLQPCVDGQCPTGYVCVEGICLPECNTDEDCPGEFLCSSGICLPPCTDDGDCPEGFTCAGDLCVPECDDDGICPEGFTCVEGICLPGCDDEGCPEGFTCAGDICLPDCDDGVCPEGFTCVEGVCLPDCSDDGICPPEFECVEGICLPPCEDDGTCPDGFTCAGGICLPDCSDDGVCPDGFVCVDGTCLPDCSDDGICPDGFTCVDGVCQPPNDDAPADGRLYGRQLGQWEWAIPPRFTEIPAVAAPAVDTPTTLGIAIDTDAPSDGITYGRINNTWAPALIYADSLLPFPGPNSTGFTNGSGAEQGGGPNPLVYEIIEAPDDGLMYGRLNADWNKVLQWSVSTLPRLPLPPTQ